MPSFSTEVKNELARHMYEDSCCQKAELAALLRMGASLTIGPKRTIGISFNTENAAVARKVLTLIKSIGEGKIRTEVSVSRSQRLKKNNSYALRAVPSPQVKEFLSSIGLMRGDGFNVGSDAAILKKNCCRVAYLRGSFQGGGSVNRPDASCHLEMVTGNYAFAAMLVSILRKMDMPVGFTDRKKDYVIYLKDGEAILDFLGMMEADKAVEALEVARNIKEVRSQVNRIVNCETANLQKTVTAAIHQINSIRQLEKNGLLMSLSPKLKDMARIRIENPEATLQELAEIAGLSKSAINHRLRKIEEIARNA